MSTAESTNKQSESVETRVTRYDEFSASLVSAVIVLAVLVAVLFGIWMTGPGSDEVNHSTVVVDVESGDDNDVSDKKLVVDIDEPGLPEFPEIKNVSIQKALVALTHLPSPVQSAIRELDGVSGVTLAGKSGAKKDRRRPRPVARQEVQPDWQRWKIRYSADSRAEYLEILESFDIYLGVVNQFSNRIDFLNNLAGDPVTVSVGDRSSPESQCLYFRNTKTRLRRWDEITVRGAGIDLDDKIVVQFYPDTIRQHLLELEQAVCERDGKELEEVKQTLFGCRSTDDGFEYFVEDVTWRK